MRKLVLEMIPHVKLSVINKVHPTARLNDCAQYLEVKVDPRQYKIYIAYNVYCDSKLEDILLVPK